MGYLHIPRLTGYMKLVMIAITIVITLTASQPAWCEEKEKPIYPGYPLSFDGQGSMDGLYKERIVINDGTLHLASGATFNLPDALNSGPSGFRIGDQVAFLLNSKGEIESIWLIKRSEKKKK